MKTLALIAHDGRKAQMVAFAVANKEALQSFKLIGTGTTASLIRREGFEIEGVLSGPMGGDAQIGAMVAKGTCDAVFFFRDPLGKHPHDPDIGMLMRLCDVHDVPIATNRATARLLISARNLLK